MHVASATAWLGRFFRSCLATKPPKMQALCTYTKLGIMNHRKIRNYAWLFLAGSFFTIGTFFSLSDPELLKASGGIPGLIAGLLSIIVISIQPIFGKLSGVLIFYPVGFFLVYRFYKEFKRINNNA